MSSAESPDDVRASSTDDTAAFQRFYQEGTSIPAHGLVYRLFIGWWRDRR